MNIIVVDYNPNWKTLYEKEAKAISMILQDILVDIHHIGSTAIENLKAKPIIDIMPIVKDIDDVDKYNTLFEGLGYECMGELGIRNRRYFRKGGDNRTHQIHIFQEEDEPNIIRHLAVRDYLRSHTNIMEEYGELKAELANKFPKDIEGYCTGKEIFMQDLETKALHWHQAK